MSHPDLALADGLHRVGHAPEVLADRDQVSRGIAGHVAVEPQPVDGGLRALFLPRLGDSKFGCLPGEGEQLHVDDESLLAEPLAPLVVGQMSGDRGINVLRREHRNRLPTKCSNVNLFAGEIRDSPWVPGSPQTRVYSTRASSRALTIASSLEWTPSLLPRLLMCVRTVV